MIQESNDSRDITELEWVEVKTHIEFEKKIEFELGSESKLLQVWNMKLKIDYEDHNFFDYV